MRPTRRAETKRCVFDLEEKLQKARERELEHLKLHRARSKLHRARSKLHAACLIERAREHQRLLQNESFTAAKPRRHDLPPQGAGIGRPSSAQTHKVIIRRTDTLSRTHGKDAGPETKGRTDVED